MTLHKVSGPHPIAWKYWEQRLHFYKERILLKTATLVCADQQINWWIYSHKIYTCYSIYVCVCIYIYIHTICVYIQFSSVTQSCPILCDPMNGSTPGLPVHHQLLEFTQTHVHRVGDAIQPSHPLTSPSPPAPNPSQHQGVFQ